MVRRICSPQFKTVRCGGRRKEEEEVEEEGLASREGETDMSSHCLVPTPYRRAELVTPVRHQAASKA